MRIEQINAQALERVDYDRYLLSVAVAKRVEQLAKGEEPLVKVKDNTQPSEIAIMEIAQGLIQVKGE